MAQNLLVNGIVYNGVTAIEMTNESGEKVQYTEGGNGGSGGSEDMAGALADRTITDFVSNTCTKIGVYAFRECTKLKTLIAPNATTVEEYSLYHCSALTSIVLPSVTSISTNAFREASNLEYIDLPKLTAIPSNGFFGCRGIKALILRSQNKVTLSSTSAFTQCYRLLGTKNSGYNPTGEKIGFIYVPASLIEQYAADTVWVDTGILFRALEDYTMDGTINGELDETKI